MTRWRDSLYTVRMLMAWATSAVRPMLRVAVWSLGVLALILVLLACTRVPFDAHRWLGTAAGECAEAPQAIVLLGGSGMPSGPELLRLDRGAELARQCPHASVLVVHPGDPSVLERMVNELVLKGVGRERIVPVNEGDNTRAQALACLRRYAGEKPTIALVTAPENMYRSVLTFRRAGFLRGVCGAPAWDHAMDHDFDYAHRRIGGKAWVPDVSGKSGLRYTFWNYLKLEITCLREYAAIAYYWLNDWI